MQGEPNRGLRFGGPGEPAEPLRLSLRDGKVEPSEPLYPQLPAQIGVRVIVKAQSTEAAEIAV